MGTIKEMLNALCISDLQIPFEHKDALEFTLRVKKVVFGDLPVHIVNMGDEVDQHTLSNWVHSPKAMGTRAEFEEAKLRLKEWAKHFPKKYICISNHTYRVYKRADEAGIPEAFMKTVGEAYELPLTWQWKEKWIHEDVCFEHGENVSGITAAINAAKQNLMSTVIGHQHSNAGVQWCASETRQIFGLNTGCLIDVRQYAFDYGKNIRNKPTLGLGVIRNGIPYFIPMILDHQGRWVKRL